MINNDTLIVDGMNKVDTGMKMGASLNDITRGLEISDMFGDDNISVDGITSDSREVRDGFIFAALKGERRDGHIFLQDAINRGAAAVLVERFVPDLSATQIVVPDTREALGRVADVFYGEPSSALSVVGVTGTNGKTTTTYLIESILNHAGLITGVIGTVSYRYGKKNIPALYTTPEAPEIHKLLRDMVDDGVTHCVMEVSSHALAQKRVDGCRFAVGIFTNLTQDHLDFHNTMEDYFASKARLFESLITDDGKTVINIDDPWAKTLIRDLTNPLIGFSLENKDADIVSRKMVLSEEGIEAELSTPIGSMKLSSPLIGEYNLKNIMAAVGTGIALGLDKAVIEEGIRCMERVPGRMECISSPDGFKAIVDFAHTADALERVLKTLRCVSKNRIITVFGCGGDRDRGKRPLMGKVVVRWSDITIITSDNPRGEDPLDIINEIESGIGDVRRYEPGEHVTSRGYMILSDRREAIRRAIVMASAGDIVLLAGKGHENYQIIGDKKIPFDDMEELKMAIEKRRRDKPDYTD
ncbi:MAG: UDP-N-acetylmuramoyl-L-alanyl-D-glutamate--2,6-diaminopimelate ligase [Thermodesulfobacteriota bacterium]